MPTYTVVFWHVVGTTSTRLVAGGGGALDGVTARSGPWAGEAADDGPSSLPPAPVPLDCSMPTMDRISASLNTKLRVTGDRAE